MTSPNNLEVPPLVKNRPVTGYSAVILPFTPGHEVDWTAFDAHVLRTLEAGLIPAVNMDTGYINLLDDATRLEVLNRTRSITGGRQFVAGAYIADSKDSSFDLDGYTSRMEDIQQHGGTPVIFQSYGLTQQDDDGIVSSYQSIGQKCDQFVAFELGEVFLPFGKIYSMSVYKQLMQIPNCIGAKHSSLRRDLEWQRLALRNEIRPDFKVLTGNDLAIDMIIYGSDYLLGLSSFCPDLFGKRDRMWASGDPQFYQLNDILQYLGFFAFRSPVPAYKHTCAQLLHLRGHAASNLTHPDATERPASDVPILEDILRQLADYE